MTEGLSSLESLIERLEAAALDARLAVTETHSAIKALRIAEREARDLLAMIDHAAGVAVDERLNEAVQVGLEKFQTSYQKAIEAQLSRVMKVFEEYANLCMYGNRQGKGTNLFEEAREQLLARQTELARDPSLPTLPIRGFFREGRQ